MVHRVLCIYIHAWLFGAALHVLLVILCQLILCACTALCVCVCVFWMRKLALVCCAVVVYTQITNVCCPTQSLPPGKCYGV